MTVKVLEPSHIDEALSTLTSLSQLSQKFPHTEFVFRGQQNSQWPLCTSYDRYWAGKTLYDEFFVERMVRQFQSGVARLGLETSLGRDRLAWLEYARHHGPPAPLLDFSWSPFVALYFAFDGVRDGQGPSQSGAVYALNLNQLAKETARRKVTDVSDLDVFSKAMDDFLYRGASRLKSEFPRDELLFIRYPNAHTRRMHVQLGVILYSTISFGCGPTEPSNLEEFLDKIQEGFDSPCLPNEGSPVLIKMKLPHSWVSEVFSRLEVISISGSTMFLSAEGVAKDVYNSFNYHPRARFLREDSSS
jgi:hypothetical protein